MLNITMYAPVARGVCGNLYNSQQTVVHKRPNRRYQNFNHHAAALRAFGTALRGLRPDNDGVRDRQLFLTRRSVC